VCLSSHSSLNRKPQTTPQQDKGHALLCALAASRREGVPLLLFGLSNWDAASFELLRGKFPEAFQLLRTGGLIIPFRDFVVCHATPPTPAHHPPTHPPTTHHHPSTHAIPPTTTNPPILQSTSAKKSWLGQGLLLLFDEFFSSCLKSQYAGKRLVPADGKSAHRSDHQRRHSRHQTA
jgi:hypothetical protein